MRRVVAAVVIAVIAAVVIAGSAAGAWAQEPGAAAAGPAMETRAWHAAAVPELLTTPGGAFAASLLLPGSGQAALGARRWAAYAAIEVAAWVVRLDALGDRRAATVAYRDLAWDEARTPGELDRRDGSWGYYETLTLYARSGAFDADPARAGVQPEEDPTTYNGTVWSLARSIYLPDGEGEPGAPGYDLALQYYDERAAGPAFLWSWEGNEDAWARFRSLIGDADSASRTAGIAFGVVLANHMVSAVDAFIIARLRSEPGIRLESRVEPSPFRWSVGLHIPLENLQ